MNVLHRIEPVSQGWRDAAHLVVTQWELLQFVYSFTSWRTFKLFPIFGSCEKAHIHIQVFVCIDFFFFSCGRMSFLGVVWLSVRSFKRKLFPKTEDWFKKNIRESRYLYCALKKWPLVRVTLRRSRLKLLLVLLLWLGRDPWRRNFCMPWAQPKKSGC